MGGLVRDYLEASCGRHPQLLQAFFDVLFIVRWSTAASTGFGNRLSMWDRKRFWLKGLVLRNGADGLARPAPGAVIGFVKSVDRAARANDLKSFVLRQIAPYRAVRNIGLGTHHAGRRAVERSGDVDHIKRVISRAIVGDGGERANQNQSCQH